MNKEIKWGWVIGEIKDSSTIEKIENTLGIKYPQDYVECVKLYNGGYPIPSCIDVNGNEESINDLLNFNEQDIGYILEEYNDVKDRLPDKIYPFARDAGGNLFCFDYRNGSEPTIVFWDHEKAFINKETAIQYVCNSFTE